MGQRGHNSYAKCFLLKVSRKLVMILPFHFRFLSRGGWVPFPQVARKSFTQPPLFFFSQYSVW